MVDRHGTGRVLFRNRRVKISGFPKRDLIAIPLTPSSQYLEKFQKIDPESAELMELMDHATGRSSDRVVLEDEQSDKTVGLQTL